jgi:hypothetical protein
VVSAKKNRPLVERRFLPDEEAQLRALRVLVSSVNKAKRAAEQSGRRTLARKETDESSANRSLP